MSRKPRFPYTMKNKNVGFLITGIGVVIVVIVLLFNYGLRSIVDDTCSHGSSCTMYDTISLQTYFSLAIAAVVLIIGLFLIFSKEEIVEKVVIKKQKVEVERKRKPVDYSSLAKEEKHLVKLIEESKGTMFQSDIVDVSGYSKVKVSRILDKLEGRQLIERKRRGMTNVVLLK